VRKRLHKLHVVEFAGGVLENVERNARRELDVVLERIVENAKPDAVERELLHARVVLLGEAVQQLVAERAEVGSAGVGGVVAGSCRRWPRVEVMGRRESLRQQGRADGLRRRTRRRSVPLNERAVRTAREHGLANGPDPQRVDAAAKDAEKHCHGERGPGQRGKR
jgi:hypothetical protein